MLSPYRQTHVFHGNQMKIRIPRKPSFSDKKLEEQMFRGWLAEMNSIREVDGLVLTPFERNPDKWRELWRVVEKSDIIVQIVDARNPLLFRSKDLESYVKEVGQSKQNVLLVNKADLLKPEQLESWKKYFEKEKITFIFWSAMNDVMETMKKDKDAVAVASTSTNDNFVTNKDELIAKFKKLGGKAAANPVIVGMVGYPNVGKSSTINKLAGGKKVSFSATPGKTRHFQTIHIDSQLCLCDCPGLVMPSFSFGRSEMFLNGILPINQMRDHFGLTSSLLSRVPLHVIEGMYSIMLPQMTIPSAKAVLNSIGIMRGFWVSTIPDCSRAARLLLKDVVSGKLKWAAAPPGEDQEEFDKLSYPENKTLKSLP